MEFFIKDNLPTIVLLAQEHIAGLMDQYMKAKSKMDYVMAKEFIKSMMLLMKENGKMVRNKGKVK